MKKNRGRWILMVIIVAALLPGWARAEERAFDVYAGYGAASNHFEPSGWMPADGVNMIAFSDNSSDNPHSGKTCIKIGFHPETDTSWAGITWLAGGKWGEVRGYNITKELGLKPEQRVVLSFYARGKAGGEHAEFKVGGVNRGQFPDSIPFPVSSGIVTLNREWTEFTIDLTGRDLSNVAGGFIWVANAPSNPGKSEVWIYLSDIRFEAL